MPDKLFEFDVQHLLNGAAAVLFELAGSLDLIVVVDGMRAEIVNVISGIDRLCPVHGIVYDALHIGVVEGRAGLVAGLEVENLPVSALTQAARNM